MKWVRIIFWGTFWALLFLLLFAAFMALASAKLQEKPQEWNPNDVTSSFVLAGWLKHADRITITLKNGENLFITGSTLQQLEKELNSCHEIQTKKLAAPKIKPETPKP